jgi:23S rRNA (adenine2030-N6)-methyltransferase
MNYRHAYHAGNFADVLKHAVLALVIEHLKRKDAPFRVIDTHAGPGLYDLASEEAQKTGEWRDGIGRLLHPSKPLPDAAAEVLAPYLQAVAAVNHGKTLQRYPGSPCIALALMRPHDRLVANELHPEDAARLAAHIGRDRRAKSLALDGWTALKSLLPPKERRGVVLVDPPFEATDEFDKLALGLREALRRFATGTYLLWYPIKDQRRVASFRRSVAAVSSDRALSIELFVGAARRDERLSGCGLIVINPPHTLPGKLNYLASFLPQHLEQWSGSSMCIESLSERASR